MVSKTYLSIRHTYPSMHITSEFLYAYQSSFYISLYCPKVAIQVALS